MYQVLGVYRTVHEILDTAESIEEALSLVREYQIALGDDWAVGTIQPDWYPGMAGPPQKATRDLCRHVHAMSVASSQLRDQISGLESEKAGLKSLISQLRDQISGQESVRAELQSAIEKLQLQLQEAHWGLASWHCSLPR